MIPVRVKADTQVVLASERRFHIAAGHPLSRSACPACGGPLTSAVCVLVFVGIDPETRAQKQGIGYCSGGAVAVHAVCAGVAEGE